MADRRIELTEGPDGPRVVKVALDEPGRQLTEQEAERLRRACHPGVVELVSHDGDRLELAWAGDRTLELVHPELAAAADLLGALAATIADLHDIGLVHGRIDPSHVVIGPDGRPRLCGMSGPRPDDEPAPTPADDVAALGALMDRLLGTGADLEPIPDRRWAPRRWSGYQRRALLNLADQANHHDPDRRPSARALATAIAETAPRGRSATPSDPGAVGRRRWRGVQPGPAEPGAVEEHGPLPADGTLEDQGDGLDDDHGRGVVDRSGIGAENEEAPDAGAARFTRNVAVMAVGAVLIVVAIASGVAGTTAPTAGSDPDGGPSADTSLVDLDASPTTAAGVRSEAGLGAGTDEDEAEDVEDLGDRHEADRTASSTGDRGEDAGVATDLAAHSTAGPGTCPPAPGEAAGAGGDDPCTGQVVVDGLTVHAGDLSFRAGRDGDYVAVGDWRCSGLATPGLVRPSTGEVFLFERWPTGGEPVEVEPVAVVPGAAELVPGDAGSTCGAPSVRTADGSTTTLAVEVGEP